MLDVGSSYNAASLTVTNGLTLNGTAAVAIRRTATMEGISFAGNQASGGNGTVVFWKQRQPLQRAGHGRMAA